MRAFLFLGLMLVLAACGPAPTPAPTVAGPVEAVDEAAGFRLTLQLDRPTFRAGEEITGRAMLAAAVPTEVAGSGGGLIGFSLHDIDRGRAVIGGQDSSCEAYALDPASPYTTELQKSGGFDPQDPAQDWIEAFLTDPVYRLPAGTWEIDAWTNFLGRGCELPAVELSARIRIVVTE